jgi:curli biogenesis system outer membrane secretion channel CsgG
MKVKGPFVIAMLVAPILPIHGSDRAHSAVSAAGSQQKSSKKRMGVPSFDNTTQTNDPAYGDRMADMLISALSQNKNYELIERSRLSAVMEEQGLGMSGILDQSNVAQVGKIEGLDFIVLGSLVEASSFDKKGASGTALAANLLLKNANVPVTTVYSTEVTVGVNLKVVEVETGKIVLSDRASASETFSWGAAPQQVTYENYLSAARKAIEKAAFKIMREIAPLEPSILKAEIIKGKQKEVIVDMGRDDGIREGQHWEIVREGEPLLDRNGEIVGVEITKIAAITIMRVEATTSYGKVIKLHKNQAGKGDHEIVRGDLLRMQDQHGKMRGIRDLWTNAE